MAGFFASTGTLANSRSAPTPLLPRCGKCGLYRGCLSPKMPVDGKGRKRVLLLGEAPGETEDQQGKPFIGKAGKLLQRYLEQLDVNIRRDCWVLNSLICRPPGNRTPTDKEISYCLPNVVKVIKDLKPDVIIPLGATAVKSLIGWLWRDRVEAISRWVGWRIPVQKINCWVCPTFHPSYLARQEGKKDYPVVERFFLRHLKAAFALEGRPWVEVPDYRKQIKVLINPDEAGRAIRIMIASQPRAVAWDIETNKLKPDSEGARIFSCSLSDGEVALSYPWCGEATKATLEFLQSPIPKIGYNAKFEARWLQARHGIRVRNWVHDGMQAAHVLDNRKGITSLKFQAWVLLGQDGYDEAIKPYLKAKGSNEANRIREAPLEKVLLYGGLDSLLEYKVAEIQAQQLGLDWLVS